MITAETSFGGRHWCEVESLYLRGLGVGVVTFNKWRSTYVFLFERMCQIQAQTRELGSCEFYNKRSGLTHVTNPTLHCTLPKLIPTFPFHYVLIILHYKSLLFDLYIHIKLRDWATPIPHLQKGSIDPEKGKKNIIKRKEEKIVIGVGEGRGMKWVVEFVGVINYIYW